MRTNTSKRKKKQLRLINKRNENNEREKKWNQMNLLHSIENCVHVFDWAVDFHGTQFLFFSSQNCCQLLLCEVIFFRCISNDRFLVYQKTTQNWQQTHTHALPNGWKSFNYNWNRTESNAHWTNSALCSMLRFFFLLSIWRTCTKFISTETEKKLFRN